MNGDALSLRPNNARNASSQNLNIDRVHRDSDESGLAKIDNPEIVHTLQPKLSSEQQCRLSNISEKDARCSDGSSIRFKSWRRVVAIVAAVSLLAFVANMVALAWMIKSPVSEEGLTQLFSGSCSTVAMLDLWLHLAINIFSTGLLGASNYCMQCLTAPNRNEIDAAHQSGQWLDIGLLSMRNLRRFNKKKTAMWLVLAMASVPLHLFYNAAFYASYYNNEYQYFIVAQDFPDGAAFDITPIHNDTGTQLLSEFIDIIPAQRLVDPWVRLTAEECVDAYARFYLRDHRNLVVVTSNTTVPNGQNGTGVSNNPERCNNGRCGALLNANSAGLGGYAFEWMCGGGPLWDSVQSPCFENVDILKFQAAQGEWQTQDGFLVDHCIAERSDEVCAFHGNTAMIAVVAGFNLISAVLMFTIIWQLRGNLLLVIGDAIASFLSDPDPTTSGLCLLSKEDVTQRKLWPSKLSFEDMKHFTMFAKLPSMRRSSAANRSVLGYAVCTSITTIVAMLGVFFLAYAYFRRAPGPTFNPFSITTLSTFGFGTPNPLGVIDDWALFSLPSANSQVIASLLIANLPQLVLSLFYIFINRYLTNLHLVQEWNDFLTYRKSLRGTWSAPRTGQLSTYCLQLPLQGSFLLMATTTILHWLLSSSMFIAVVRDYDAGGALIKGVLASSNLLKKSEAGGVSDTQSIKFYASIGFSPTPIVALLAVLGLLLLCVFGVGLRKLRSGMPVVGSCSAAISASCHQPSWDGDSETKPLLWGAVSKPEITALERYATTNHCCFSSVEVESVVQGGEYN